ncbi:hypothetical protein GKE82_00025 [Conexibacter sp. W3-3-2]|uniref:hypothetical protein n=1 Tax=Conexibacter sp. W3-3-2 TaxID=2675227 RepID=UPI0012B7E8B2|nr:hypothetical protein [Conexibacter sp. W3-3-2]MTD42732.1 hypothetical protein [Conexibacter sp. W3-3-2]
MPLSVFAGQGLDPGAVRKLEPKLGEWQFATGSIQLADVRASRRPPPGSPGVRRDDAAECSSASGPTCGPDPMAIIDATQRVSTAVAGDVIGLSGAVRTGAACTDRVAPSLALGRIAVTGGHGCAARPVTAAAAPPRRARCSCR